MISKVLLLVAFSPLVLGQLDAPWIFEDDILDEIHMHGYVQERGASRNVYNKEEETAQYWTNKAQSTLNEKLGKEPNTGIAKNVIMFLGDGMSIPTLTAARAYLGQSLGTSGEETELSFERFPYTGLSKTYCVDSQVADSACSATAYLCGVKSNLGTAGVTAAVSHGDCEAMQNSSNHVYSIARWAQVAGKRTGVVTTTRVTHASPSGVYAHTANRNWESDISVKLSGADPKVCPDIADQLTNGETGRNLNVILGGGRGHFVPLTQKDDEGRLGNRFDGRNLIDEWKAQKAGSSSQYVYNRTGLFDVPDDTEYLLGLFEKSHTKYNIDRDPVNKPSLAEMTVAAIKVLSQGENGYFLFVEGGRIDHAHHFTLARKVLNETVELHAAVQAAVELTSPEDTLIVVTSDHAHTMSVNGYPERGNDILGVSGTALDGLPYTTLSYANGPGYRVGEDGDRHDVSNDNLGGNNYMYPALAPLISETHGGDDVAIFAVGPWAHLFTGVVEQNLIPHIMAYASCVGDGTTVCNKGRSKTWDKI